MSVENRPERERNTHLTPQDIREETIFSVDSAFSDFGSDLQNLLNIATALNGNHISEVVRENLHKQYRDLANGYGISDGHTEFAEKFHEPYKHAVNSRLPGFYTVNRNIDKDEETTP